MFHSSLRKNGFHSKSSEYMVKSKLLKREVHSLSQRIFLAKTFFWRKKYMFNCICYLCFIFKVWRSFLWRNAKKFCHKNVTKFLTFLSF